MGLWPLNASELLRNSSTHVSSPSLQNLALQTFIRNLKVDNASAQIESLPTKVLIDVLEALCEYPDFIQELMTIMLKPSILSRILQYNDRYQWKIVECFQYLETERTNFVERLAESVFVSQESFGYASLLKLGYFLAETGWHKEAIKVLEVALQQAGDHQLRRLEVMGQLLISQVFTKSSIMERTVEGILSNMKVVELPSELRISLNHAISLKHFETCNFQSSYQYALDAFHNLNSQSSPNQLIPVFTHLSKACIPLKRFNQAKLLITQAVALAWHHSPSDAIYARTLEDYAMYLATVNAVEDAMNVFSEAQQILLNLYGPRNLQQTVTQGNLTFGMYLQAYIYRELGMAKRYLRNAADLMEQFNSADRRLLVAIGRAEALLEADIERVGGGGRERDLVVRDQLDGEKRAVMKIGEVQRLYRDME